MEQEPDVYDAAHKKEAVNVFLLNAQGPAYPYEGSITDVQIWDRALTREQTEMWSRCQYEDGNYLKWSNAQFNVTGDIEISEITKDKVNRGFSLI